MPLAVCLLLRLIYAYDSAILLSDLLRALGRGDVLDNAIAFAAVHFCVSYDILAETRHMMGEVSVVLCLPRLDML